MSESIGERIEKIIDSKGLKRVELAKLIKVDQSYITPLIKGKNVPSDRLIDDICEKLNINPVWLRTGQGDMQSQETMEQEFTRTAARIVKSHDEMIMNMVIEYWKLDPESRELLINFIRKIAQKKE